MNQAKSRWEASRVAAVCFLAAAAACAPLPRGDAVTPLAGAAAAEVTAALLEHVAVAFPGEWAGVPAEVYCVDAASAAEIGNLRIDRVTPVVPVTECALEIQPGGSAAGYRVRHLPSGRPAIIYRFGKPQRGRDGTVGMHFEWFAAHHFSAGYSCTLVQDGADWRVADCAQTHDYRTTG